MKSALETFYEIVKSIVIVLLAAFIIRFFLFQPFVVEGNSMEPSLHDKEYLIVNRLTYRIGDPQRGDVVVFDAPNSPGTDYIKRVIGLPGEKIKIVDDEIFINANKIDEKYLPTNFKTLIDNSSNFSLERQLGPDEYFVMGDNREHSLDSREIGTIKKQAIIGKAWVTLYPLSYFGAVFKPSY